MKDALRNYLKEQDEVVAVYCKVVSLCGTPTKDIYSVVFYQKDGGSFSINDDFTEEELTKAKRYWKFVEKWYEVKSMKNILRAKVTGGNFYLLGINDAVENIWEEWRKQGLLNCKGPED
jgi:hypothetical protein